VKYHRTQILLEIEQHQALAEIAEREKRSISDLIRKMIRERLAAYRQAELQAAARALLEEYHSDPELTALTVLDSEDFHAER
jgi:predicted DNA-binding ribbon-helix-helix protein